MATEQGWGFASTGPDELAEPGWAEVVGLVLMVLLVLAALSTALWLGLPQ
jgi:hypothetical protein